jgi:hypothetical protein
MLAQIVGFSRIHEIDRAAKIFVSDPHMLWRQDIVALWVLDVGLKSWPTGKAVFPSNRELRVAWREGSVADSRVVEAAKPRMKFPNSLAGVKRPRSMTVAQVFCLTF